MKTIGIFSKLGMPGGSENRVTQLANSFCETMPTYIFAEKEFSRKLKSQLNEKVILREQTVNTTRHIFELQGVDILLVVNSDSYSFCKPSYWDGTQGKHHKSVIDISQIPTIGFLFNYVVGPAQWLVGMHKINSNIKLLTTSKWFTHNINTENKFNELRKLKLPLMEINSPVSSKYDQEKTESKIIRINRHSMSFAYKHDEDNLQIVKTLCDKYGDKISFTWMGVPSHVRDTSSTDKDQKVPYRSKLEILPQFHVVETYSKPIPDFLQETDILLFYISRFRKEPWPRTIAEGMTAGCCCVTNNSYGMAEQIKSGETGYLCDNANDVIRHLSNLIENPKKIREIGENARQHAKKHFRDTVVTDKTLKFLGG